MRESFHFAGLVALTLPAGFVRAAPTTEHGRR